MKNPVYLMSLVIVLGSVFFGLFFWNVGDDAPDPAEPVHSQGTFAETVSVLQQGIAVSLRDEPEMWSGGKPPNYFSDTLTHRNGTKVTLYPLHVAYANSETSSYSLEIRLIDSLMAWSDVSEYHPVVVEFRAWKERRSRMIDHHIAEETARLKDTPQYRERNAYFESLARSSLEKLDTP